MRVGGYRQGTVDEWPALIADVTATNGSNHAIYFSAPVEELVVSADPFLLGLFPIAASRRESLHVDGEVDPDLIDGVEAAGAWHHFWYPEHHPVPVEVRAEPRTAQLSLGQRRAAASFVSGGVDSFSALLRNLGRCPEGHPARIARAINVNSFHGATGALAKLSESNEDVARHLKQIMPELGVSLLPMRTNLRSLIDYSGGALWMRTMHGAALATFGHALALDVSNTTIASTHSIPFQHPWGSHASVDPLYSSSYLAVRHDGVQFSRFERTAQLVACRPVREQLHVCTGTRDSVMNCGRCEKCVRTMVALDLLGELRRAPTFPADRVTPEAVAALRLTPYLLEYRVERARGAPRARTPGSRGACASKAQQAVAVGCSPRSDAKSESRRSAQALAADP